jgi:AAA domain (dynein-related subfamily)
MSITKSCLECPSLLTKDEAEAFFGVAEAAPMCSRFGHIFGQVGTEVVFKDQATRMAEGCTAYGQSAASSPPPSPSLGWFDPRPELLNPTSSGPSFCGDCRNYDKAMKGCAATGRVIFPERQSEEAKSCAFGVIGNPQETVASQLQSLGTTTQVFVGIGKTATSQPAPQKATKAAAQKKAPAFFDPTTYSSDAPVDDVAKANGIQAWFKLTTRRGKEYFLPIFRGDFFGADEALIPTVKSAQGDHTLYIDHANLLEEFAVQVYKKDLNIVLMGEPGTGKTEGWRYVAHRLNMPFVRLAYNEASEPDQFLGLYEFDPVKGTYLNPGFLPEWWVKPVCLLSDEPNTPDSNAIVQAYRSMNDSSRELVVYKQRFVRHDYCFHAMAMNPHWDFRNIGTKPLASADSRRLSFFWMPNPDKDMLRQIISTSVERLDGVAPEDALLDVLVKIGDDLRDMSKQGTLPDFWTVSQEIKVARLVEDFGIEGAYRRAYFNYIDPNDAEAAMGAIKSHIPYGSSWA